ncbi:exonuclease VIII [Escherichia coli]|nr:exonuclease VIII [Escherichia coli]MDM5020525.1 exonuclease VIII [Escherichia coli]
MSKVFICAAIPDEQAIKEEGAVAVATAIEAGDERRARAKFTWQFLEQYPAAQDCAYKFLVCEDKPGMPRPAIDSWDTEYMLENRWDEESASFVPVEPEPNTDELLTLISYLTTSRLLSSLSLAHMKTSPWIWSSTQAGILGDDDMMTFRRTPRRGNYPD